MIALAATMGKVFEQGDPNTAVCCKNVPSFQGPLEEFCFRVFRHALGDLEIFLLPADSREIQ
jgi:hypothetical protein